MTQELTIVTATPVVTLTKSSISSEKYVNVRANDTLEGLSIHYGANVDWGEVPTVHDKLLVAVVAGVYPTWLARASDLPIEGGTVSGQVPITFHAVSARAHGGGNPSRAEQFDAFHFNTVIDDAAGGNGARRLNVFMQNESGSIVHASAVLSKGQVSSMLAALLVLYPRLQEA